MALQKWTRLYYSFDELPALLNTKEVAVYLRCSTEFVTRLIRQGKLHGVRVGKNWVVPKEALAKMVGLEMSGPQVIQ